MDNTAERLYLNDRDGWHTYADDVWVELDFGGKTADIYSIVTRGTVHHLGVFWVKSYKLQYKKPGDDAWRYVTDTNGQPEVRFSPMLVRHFGYY